MTAQNIFDAATVGGGVTLNAPALIATYSGSSSGADSGVKGLASLALSSGKVYFEMRIDGGSVNAGDTGFGICTPTSTYPNMGNNATQGAMIFFGGGGNVYINGSHISNIGTILTSDWVAIAVDFGANKIWFKDLTQGGTWNNNNEDPTTGVSTFTIPSGLSYVPIGNFSNGHAGTLTANFGDSPLFGTVPTGFTLWSGGSPITTPFTSFDPSKSNPGSLHGVVLSNNNLTASFISPSGVQNGAAGYSADLIDNVGKNYIEFTYDVLAGGTIVGVSAEGSDTDYGFIVNAGGSFGFFLFPDGTIWQGGSQVGSISTGTVNQGDVIGLAYDFVTPLGWFKNITQNSDWNNSGANDPATGTGGISAVSGQLVPSVAYNDTGAAKTTANFGQQAFVGAVPSGFTAGWIGVSQPPATPSGTFWNAADQSGTGTVLSDGDATITNTTTSNVGIRATPTARGDAGGKFYLELTTVQIAQSAGNGTIGFTDLAATLQASSEFGLNYFGSGMFSNGTSGATAGNFGFNLNAGTPVIGFAVDFDNGAFWATIDGVNWIGVNGTPNPVTNTDGFPLEATTSITFPVIPHIYSQNLFGGQVTATLNTGQRPFVLAQPVGFQSWDGGTAPQPPTVGDLHAVEAPDVFVGVGNVAATVVMRVAEAADVFSAFGRQPQTGVFATSEAPDVFRGTGIGRGEDGTFITVEAPDIFSGIGSVPITGALVITETADRFFAIGAGATQVTRRRSSFVT